MTLSSKHRTDRKHKKTEIPQHSFPKEPVENADMCKLALHEIMITHK